MAWRRAHDPSTPPPIMPLIGIGMAIGMAMAPIPRRLRLVARTPRPKVRADAERRGWRARRIAIEARRRRRHRPGLRALIQAGRLRASLLSRLARDRERGAPGC